jgi:hypothetical protein
LFVVVVVVVAFSSPLHGSLSVVTDTLLEQSGLFLSTHMFVCGSLTVYNFTALWLQLQDTVL